MNINCYFLKITKDFAARDVVEIVFSVGVPEVTSTSFV